jgi:transposase
MLIIPPAAKVYLATSAVDFRKHAKGLKKWIQNELKLNPFSSAYFIFLSKNRKSMKILHFDGQGICLYWKALSKGSFQKWRRLHDVSIGYNLIHPTEGQVMLMNGNSQQLKIPKNWKEIS